MSENMSKYSCELCKKEFLQKIDYTRHINKKTPCISLSEIQKINKLDELKTDIKGKIISVISDCLDIARLEGLVNDLAMQNISYLLILKLIEPKLETEINIDNYDYDFSHVGDDVEIHKNKLLEIVRFSNLSNEKEENIPNNIKILWDDILSKHPSTKNVFLKGKGFDIQRSSTYKRLIDKLNTINLVETSYDVLGNAYEEVIQNLAETGRGFGQFFTQPLVKKMMVKLIDPQIYSDGKFESLGDPAMGTGGFLVTYLQDIIQKAKNKNITLDWDFVKTEGLYGKEIVHNTYQMAVSNMLISSGQMFDNLDYGDSISEPITRKFDNVLANPPFGIKGLKYDNIQNSLKNNYIPIKTDNAVSLFIQAIIYTLKINGKCAVVLPDGKDLFNKGKLFVTIREYLMKTCDLKEIIYLPSGIFTYTDVKTCVFYFVKKNEGCDILETKIRVSKTQKETGRDYTFSKTHQTTNVKFYDYNPYTDVKNLLIEVPIGDIANNSYSLNYTEYMKDEIEEDQYDEGIVIKTIDEVCKFMQKSKRKAAYGEKYGTYPFYTSSQICDKYCDEYDYEDECLIIGTGGSANIKYNSKFSCSADNYVIKVITNDLSKYIYYYLSINIEVLQKGFKGAGLQHISKEFISNIKIPFPSIDVQHKIINYLDFIYEKTSKSSNEKIIELRKLNEYCLNNQIIFGENEIKTLKDVCKVNQGTYIKPDMKIQGEYPVYGGGNISYYINQYNREDEIIVAKDGVSADCVRYEKNKFFLNHHGWTIICNDELIKKYMFYYLQSIQPELLSIAKGTAQLGINQENFYKLKISVPSIIRQKEIIEYCENNDILIKQLENEIKNNKKQAHQYINAVIN